MSIVLCSDTQTERNKSSARPSSTKTPTPNSSGNSKKKFKSCASFWNRKESMFKKVRYSRTFDISAYRILLRVYANTKFQGQYRLTSLFALVLKFAYFFIIDKLSFIKILNFCSTYILFIQHELFHVSQNISLLSSTDFRNILRSL